jgi:transketolase
LGRAESLSKGAYILRDAPNGMPDVVLIGTGSEIQLALEASQELEKKNLSVRVVSMPSWELFDKQSREYKDAVLPPDTKIRVAVEAGCTQGWHQYVGQHGRVIGIDHFGASAPYNVLYEKFGITAKRVVETALEALDHDHA